MRLHVPTHHEPQRIGRRLEQLDCFDRSGREASTALRVDGLLDVLAGRTPGSFEWAAHHLSELCGGQSLVERLARPQADLRAHSVQEAAPIPLALLSRVFTPLERRRVLRQVLVVSGIEDLPYAEGIEAGSRLAAEIDRRPYLSAVFDDEAPLRRWRSDLEDLVILWIDGRVDASGSVHAALALTAAHAALSDLRRGGREAPWAGRFTDEEVLIELSGIGAEAIAGGPLSAVRGEFADARLAALRAASWLDRQPDRKGYALPKCELLPRGFAELSEASMRGHQARAADYVRAVGRVRRLPACVRAAAALRCAEADKAALEALGEMRPADFGFPFVD